MLSLMKTLLLGVNGVLLQLLGETDVASSLLEHNAVLSASVAAKHAVHLLQGGTLGLGQAEVHPENAAEQEDGEEEIGSPLPGLEHRGHVEGDGEVVEPVA